MPFGWAGRSAAPCMTRSSSTSNGTVVVPASSSGRRRGSRRARPAARSVSVVAGSSPSRPRTTALAIRGRDPWRPASRTARPGCRRTSLERPDSASPSANRLAARIGPTVWDDDGPMPTEYRSNAERAISGILSIPCARGSGAGGGVEGRGRRPLRLLHLEPRAPGRAPSPARCRTSSSTTRSAARRASAFTPRRALARARVTPPTRATSRSGAAVCARRPSRCSGSAWACRAWSRRTAGRSSGSSPRTARSPPCSTTAPGVFAGMPVAVRGGPLPLARGRRPVPDAARHGPPVRRRGGGGDGRAHRDAAVVGRAVPPRVGAHASTAPTGRELPGAADERPDLDAGSSSWRRRATGCFWLDGGGARAWSGRRSLLGWLDDDDVSLTYDAARARCAGTQHGRAEVVGDDVFAVLAARSPRRRRPRRALGRLPRLRLPARPARARPRPTACPTRSGCGSATPRSSTTPSPSSAGGRPPAGDARDVARPATWYADGVRRGAGAAAAGNSYEVNLTYRRGGRADRRPGDGVPPAARAQPRAVRRLPAAPRPVHLLSSSPGAVRHRRPRRARLETKPIKGTTPRGRDPPRTTSGCGAGSPPTPSSAPRT